MSFLANLVGKARGWLAQNERPVTPTATDAVEHDRFDAAVFRELLDTAPALSDMAYGMAREFDYSEDMVRDVLMLFYKADPKLREQAEMDPRFLLNRAVAADIAAAPETTRTRGFTKHDDYGAAMATIGVSERVKTFLRNSKVQQAMDEAADAQEQAGISFENAKTKADEAVAAAGEYAGEGPLTEAQADAQAALEAAMAQAAAAAQRADEALAAAELATQQAAQELRKPVREAIEEAGDKLEAEQVLMRTWGVADGDLQRMSFEERALLASRLDSGKLGKFRKLLGRFKTMAAAQEAHKVEYGRDEMVGLELSGDLERVVASEFVHLAGNRHARLDFLSRLQDGELLSRKYIGTERVGQGAIICAVDCSSSMSDADSNGITREVWAKAMALALLDSAQTAGRDFVGIHFSSARQVKAFHFPKGRPNLELAIAFAEEMFNGGTSFEAPMNTAMDVLEAEFNESGRAKADIVFITDGVAAITPDWLGTYQERKARLSFRTFGIKVGDDRIPAQYAEVLPSLCDNVRSVTEFADPSSVKDIFQVL